MKVGHHYRSKGLELSCCLPSFLVECRVPSGAMNIFSMGSLSRHQLDSPRDILVLFSATGHYHKFVKKPSGQYSSNRVIGQRDT